MFGRCKTKLRKACNQHTQRNHFSQVEWEKAACQSERGKCKYCIARSDKRHVTMQRLQPDITQTRICEVACNTLKTTNLVRCHNCVDTDEQQHKHEQTKKVCYGDETNTDSTHLMSQLHCNKRHQHGYAVATQ